MEDALKAETTKTSVVERFLRYVQLDTQSDESSDTVPSTAKQLVLLDLLVTELRSLGITDATRDEHGVVMATIPATTRKPGVPVIGLLAHVDTSPESPGAGVKPLVHRAWDGRDLVLPDDSSIVLRASELPELAAFKGHDIITASGTTLLGADDKSGVAAIMAAVEYLLAHPEIPHGAIRIGFTPDEEIGRGADHFDVTRFGAFCAYTLDSGLLGQLDAETFSGDSATVTFTGFNTHPGYAKDRMRNSIKAAADFLTRLPADALSPETTHEREGYLHPYVIEGGVDRTSIRMIVRDFAVSGLHEREALLQRLAREAAAAHPGISATVEVRENYRNMREVLDQHPQILDHAREAIRRAGLTPLDSAIRGGTDGSRLSFMGLPTPNLFAGQHNFHSKLEWVAATELEKAVETVVELAKVWEEQA
ncbi:MAG: peptidase T [Candidatus Eisenbacteria bacterium]|uniref:Peptidase T n=1 Tax=Eiseniibacteriota bacterium TaxID=2212470 RepID=A0A849SSN5_UNCEI|nr:peptidase T [Candidatus Eisenbacteria bacterium]